MALLKCPDCGHKVSSKANNCPGCGCPVKDIQENTTNNNKLDSKATPNGATFSPTQSPAQLLGSLYVFGLAHFILASITDLYGTKIWPTDDWILFYLVILASYSVALFIAAKKTKANIILAVIMFSLLFLGTFSIVPVIWGIVLGHKWKKANEGIH